MSGNLLATDKNHMNDVPIMQTIHGNKCEAFTNKSVDQVRTCTFVNPTSAVASNIYEGSTLDFRFENTVDRIASVYLRFLVNNSSGANYVLCRPHMAIGNVEIYSNNGSTLLYQQVTNVESWWIDGFFGDRNQHEQTHDLFGYDINYGGGTTNVLDGEQQYYYYPVAQNFFRSLHISPFCIDSNMIIRIKFNPASQNIESGSANTPEAILVVTGYEEAEHTKKYKLSRSLVPKCLSYWSPQRHMEDMTLNGGQKYQIRLSGIRGCANSLIFGIRQAVNKTSPSSQFVFGFLDSYDILDSSNRSVTGFKRQTVLDSKLVNSHLLPNLFQNHTGAIFHSFSQNPVQDIASGSSNGDVEMDGFFSLEITTKQVPFFTNGAYQLICVAMCNEMLTIKQANMTSTRT
jgi:hypothetical protein